MEPAAAAELVAEAAAAVVPPSAAPAESAAAPAAEGQAVDAGADEAASPAAEQAGGSPGTPAEGQATAAAGGAEPGGEAGVGEEEGEEGQNSLDEAELQQYRELQESISQMQGLQVRGGGATGRRGWVWGWVGWVGCGERSEACAACLCCAALGVLLGTGVRTCAPEVSCRCLLLWQSPHSHSHFRSCLHTLFTPQPQIPLRHHHHRPITLTPTCPPATPHPPPAHQPRFRRRPRRRSGVLRGCTHTWLRHRKRWSRSGKWCRRGRQT